MNLQCWRCGTALKDIILPFSRQEVCASCNADQHVCRLCQEYDPAVANACHEDRADFIQDKERANFCDYFKPQTGAYKPANIGEAAAARARLAELFGEKPADTTDNDAAQLTEQEKALAQLKRLFGDD